jgi:hypothetical protein
MPYQGFGCAAVPFLTVDGRGTRLEVSIFTDALLQHGGSAPYCPGNLCIAFVPFSRFRACVRKPLKRPLYRVRSLTGIPLAV